MVRPADLGLSPSQVAARINAAAESLMADGNTVERRARLVALMRESHGATVGACGLDDTLESIRDEMRKFADSEVIGQAQAWHRSNSYIPLEVIAQMSALGVFGLTIPEEFGGMGLGKESMCVVSEELSRGYIGVGSLGTRSEIAAELILGGGTDEQKRKWLPKIASGEVLPTAVFTEPNTGSDLASLKTRAVREDGVYKVYGNKTWITHPVRADLMTLLVRTNPEGARSPRAFHAAGREAARRRRPSVPGRRHERHRDRGARLSRHEGIRDRLRRFRGESGKSARRRRRARLQAADADLRVGAHPDGGQGDWRGAGGDGAGARLCAKPRSSSRGRSSNSRASPTRSRMMAAEIMIARQLTYYAAREKDSGRRCDLEAGMAKLLAARVAWANADNAVQIHGGNGFALEFPVSRILCDARILNIFEGAAEIQAQVIARRLLDGTN